MLLRKALFVPLMVGCITPVAALQVDEKEVPKNKFHVWLLIGHSNLAGRYKQGCDFTVNDSRIWKKRDGAWERAKEPYSLNPNWGGPSNFILQKLVEVYPKDKYPDLHFGIINNGYSQRKVADYKGSAENEIIGWAKKSQNECTIAGVIVMLGYMDRTSASTAGFLSDAKAVIAKFRTDPGMPDLPFIWGDLEISGDDTPNVREAIKQLPNEVRNCVRNTVRGPCGSGGTGGLPQEDNHSTKNSCNGGDHHFNYYGYKLWGYECVKLIQANKWIMVDNAQECDV